MWIDYSAYYLIGMLTKGITARIVYYTFMANVFSSSKELSPIDR